MQILSTLVLAAVAALHTSAVQRPPNGGSVLVASVTDGDTIDVQSVGRIRLLGIAAPRLDRKGSASAPFAVDARDRLSALVASRWVRLEYEARGASAATTTRSAYVFLDDGTCVNEVLVREGLARVTGRASLSRFAQLMRAQDEAQRQGRGIWSLLASTGTETYKMPRASKPKTKKKGGGHVGARVGGDPVPGGSLGASAAVGRNRREAVRARRTSPPAFGSGGLPHFGRA